MRILIVTWAWPPIGRIGALRPLGLAREWTARGHEVHVLTGPGDRGGEYSPDLLAEGERSGAQVHRAAAPGLPRPERLVAAHQTPAGQRVQRPISRLRQVLGQWKGFPDLQRSWIRPAAELGRSLPAFDVVLSTSPPESAHFVARRLPWPWVADFRDQWSDYLLARWDPLSRLLIDRIARWVLARAAGVTANTAGVAASMERALGRPVRLVRNGFDPPPPPAGPLRPRVLGYFGRIDPALQHPERLWPALRRLLALGRPWRLELYASPGGGGGKAIDVPQDLADLVMVLPPLSHDEALARMATMGALLVVGWETRGGSTAVGGKFYEYAGSGRPTLALAPADYEVAGLVQTTGTGLSAWTGDELVDALQRLEAYEVDPRGRESLSRAASAAALLEFLESARAGE
jgi:glycosyltransferase involved in cell wall biosynthesis